MSWFKDLTSKAEAMLVKLDQGTAQALQNPEGLINGSKLLDHAINTINSVREIGDETDKRDVDDKSHPSSISQDHVVYQNKSENNSMYPVESYSSQVICNPRDNPQSRQTKNGSIETDETPLQNHHNLEQSNQHQDFPVEQNTISQINAMSASPDELPVIQNTKKFSFKTSKGTSRQFIAGGKSDKIKGKLSTVDQDRFNRTNLTRPETHTVENSPGADDIRASINRSLQEYTNQATNSTLNYVDGNNAFNLQQTPHQSHFDSQPDLVVHHNSLLDAEPDTFSRSGSRLHSSPSFNIDVPDDCANSSRLSNDITARLLRQTASKKKSTFYLHKVINRLAKPNGQANSIFGDQMRIKLRRGQLRAASYARRLNYYFNTYPTMKYLTLGLVLMQILVIYVLFFYQSSSTTTDLSAQIKRQQQELIES